MEKYSAKIQRYESLLAKAKLAPDIDTKFLESIISQLKKGIQLSPKQAISMVKLENLINYKVRNV